MSRRALSLAGVVVLLAVTTTGVTAPPARATGGASSFSKTETVSRDHLIDGKSHVIDKRTVTLRVNETQNLRGRQEINVSWSGAHPTGGIVADQNSIDAQEEEYPVVVMECRGVASTTAPPAEQVRPQSCWTQDWSERYQDSFQTAFPAYRLDRYATTAERAQVVGAPRKLPTGCFPAPTQHWVPFIAARGHVFNDGPAGCAGQPPESQSVGGSAMPSNETFGVSGRDGRGSTKFDIWTGAENASLGCSQTVACSLVAVPIMGISCDPSAASLPRSDRPPAGQLDAVSANCEGTGNFAPGQLVTPQGGNDLAVSGSLWWSASNWRNRIVVPLTFAVPSDVCEVVRSSNDVDVYGSELLIQASGQWAPHFCLNSKLFDFTHVQTGEPQARNLLATGSAEAVFTSEPEPGGYGRPVVQAPVAVSGFAITYVIDGTNGQPYTKLRLTPRLLAKLLTESYPAELPVQQEDPALANNPLNITLDPDFIALNPGITHGVDATDSASAMLALSSNSDVTQALTTYINDDPSARAWLDGKPDQWGMVVNPAYKGIKLPVEQWPLRSKFEPKKYYGQDLNDCLFHNPVPFLPLVAAPLPTLEDISEAMQFGIAQSTTSCAQIDGTSLGEKLTALGRQTVGFRFMIGITSMGDAYRYELDRAALETSDGQYVKPDNASLRATAALLEPDKKTGTWPVPIASMLSDAAARAAYPGAMIVYAAIPTSGLPAEDAKDYATLLRFAAGIGQQPGLDVGQLPPGYLPMTTANGLGELAAYTRRAADAVAAQRGATPSLTGSGNHPRPTKSSSHPAPSTPHPSHPAAVPPAPEPQPQAAAPTSAPTSAHSASTAASSDAPLPTSSPAAANLPLARTPGIGLGGGSLAVIALLILALVGCVATPLGYAVIRRRHR